MTNASDRFRHVLMRVLEREATPEDRAEFRTLLKEHPEFLALYREQMRMHTLLLCVTEGCEKAEVAETILPSQPLGTRGKRVWQTVLAASAALLVGAVIWRGVTWQGESRLRADVAVSSLPDKPVSGTALRSEGDVVGTKTKVLVLVETLKASDVGDALDLAALNPGFRDYYSDIVLKQGIFTFGLDAGITCCLVGPARLEFIDDAHVVLRYGTLLAEVSPQAVGFLVQTPVLRVRDLGTRFGVTVRSAGASDVMVAKGRVLVEDATGRPVRALAMGWGLRMERAGHFNFLRATKDLPDSLGEWSGRPFFKTCTEEEQTGRTAVGVISMGVDAVKSAAVMNANVGDGVWRRNDNTDPLTPARWTDTANWLDGWVAGGAESQATFTNEFPDTVCRTVSIPPEGVSLGRFWFKNFGGRVKARNGAYLLVSGGPIRLEGDRPRIDSEADQLWIYSEIQGTNGLSTRADYSVNVFADSSYTGLTKVESGYWITHFDGVATSSDPVLRDFASTNDFVLTGGCLSFYGRKAMDVAVTSEWALVKGQTLATCVSGAGSGALTPGSAVTGQGVPPGTFIARIIDAKHIRLSAAATASGEGELSFASFAASCYQRIGSVECRHGNSALIVNKNGAHLLRVEVGELKGSANVLHRVSVGQDAGVLAFRNTHGYAGQYMLQGGWLELVKDGDHDPVLSNLCVSADSTICVPDATAVAVVSRLGGSGVLTKTGTGRLVANLAEASSLSIIVEEGELVLTGSERTHMGSLTLRTGARLVLPQEGRLALSDLTLNGEVWLEGPGQMRVTGNIVQSGTVHFTNGGGLTAAGGGVAVTPPVSKVAVKPVFWVDACTLTNAGGPDVALENGTRFVTRWNDVRGEGYNFATNIVRRPILRLNDLNGLPSVSFTRVSTVPSLSEALFWSRPVNDIRAVFMVVGSQEGGGILLGSSAAQNTQDFYRNAWMDYGRPILNASGKGASSALLNGLFYLNGVRVNPLATGYNGLFQLVEVYPDGLVRASAFAADRATLNGNGCQRICEMLLYNRTLSEQERVNTAEYLMRKWFGRGTPRTGLDPGLSSVQAVGACSLNVVQTNGCLSVGRYSGSGSIVKTGGGTLSLGSVAISGQALEVRAGRVVLNRGDVKKRIPSGAFLHMDASAAGSFSNVVANGTNFVEEWRDCDGGPVSAKIRHTAVRPRPWLVPDALNGRPVVDFGPLMANSPSNSFQCFLETSVACSNLMDAFVVIGSQAGGNTVFGSKKGVPRHFWRAGNSHAAPLLNAGYAPLPLRAGETRLNGVAVAPTLSGLSGGYDLVSFSAYAGEGVYMDAFANDGYVRTGGQRLAEVLIYDRALSVRERRDIEAYLMKKWFGATESGSAEDAVGVLAVAAGATAEVAGCLTVNGLASEGAVVGDVALSDGSVLTAVANSGTVTPASVSGEVILKGCGTVRLIGDTESLLDGRYEVLACESLVGGTNVSETWLIEGAPVKYGAALKIDASHIYLQVSPKGTVMMVR